MSIRQAICSKFWTYSKIGHGKVVKESQLKSVSNFNLTISFVQRNIISYYWLMGVKFSPIYHNYQKILIFSDIQIYLQFFLNFGFLVSLRQVLYLKFVTYSKIGHGKVFKKNQIKNVWKYNVCISRRESSAFHHLRISVSISSIHILTSGIDVYRKVDLW